MLDLLLAGALVLFFILVFRILRKFGFKLKGDKTIWMIVFEVRDILGLN